MKMNKHNTINKKDWILLSEYHISGFAEMAKQILDDNKIPSLIHKDIISSIFNISGGGIGNSIKLFVHKKYSKEAKDLLFNREIED